jgi:hypothetical protein
MYFNCEICGNHTYRGPKAFQRHFAVRNFVFFLVEELIVQ